MRRKSTLCLASLALALSGLAFAGSEKHGPGVDAATKTNDAPPTQGKPAPRTSTLTEAEFRQGMAVGDVKQIQYIGDGGEKLAFADFIAKVQGGRSFKKVVEGDKSLAVMTINPKGAVGPAPKENGGSTPPLKIRISAELPPLPTKDLGNSPHVLANGRHYTLLAFFFADCVPCIQEIPALNALAGAQGRLQVVAVTFETRRVASAFARQRGLKTAIVADAQAYIDALGIKVYPTLLLVSPEGRLMGVRRTDQVANHADAGLAELKSWIDAFGLDG